MGNLRRTSTLLRSVFEEGGLPLGTVSTYRDGSKWVKTRDGWVPQTNPDAGSSSTKTISKKTKPEPDEPPENTHEWQVPRRNPEKLEPEDAEQDDNLRRQAASGILRADGKTSFTPAAQAALRERTNAVVARYGLKRKLFQNEGTKVEVADLKDDHPLSGASWADPLTGKVTLSPRVAEGLASSLEKPAQEHDSPPMFRSPGPGGQDARELVRNPVHAAHALNKAVMRNHGPRIEYEGPGAAMEELSSELAARRITADTHGLEQKQLGFSHQETIQGALDVISKFTNPKEAYEVAEAGAMGLKKHDPKARLTGQEAAEIFAENAILSSSQADLANIDALAEALVAPYKRPKERTL